MKLTSTQIGALAENIVANELMIESNGRLSPFQPVADDDGVDLLIFDKLSGKAIPIQVKSRTKTLKKKGKQERGDTVHFEVRKAALKEYRKTMVLCVLLTEDLRSTERAWLFPSNSVPKLWANRENKYVMRASKASKSLDKFKKHQCLDISEAAQKLINLLK